MTRTAVPTLGGADLAAVARVMAEAGEPVAGELECSLIAGGRSNLTYRLGDGRRRWVLRTPPRAGRTPSAHDVVRELRIIAALHPTPVPVARPVAACEDEAVIGVPFAICEFVDGTTVQTREAFERLAPESVGDLTTTLVGTLAALHRVDHVQAGLGGLARADGYAARQLKRWSGQWELVAREGLGALGGELVEALAARLPDQRRTAVVHGDFRIDNTLLQISGGPGGAPRVAAVVDWELATLGDPDADVAMMCAYRHAAFDLIVGEESAWTSPLLPGVAELAATYEELAGVTLAHWEFHLALAYFKIGVIAAGIDHRRRSGAGAGPGFDTAGEAVRTYLDLGRQALRSG
ncbi:phosphotransferase family protein [Streptomyces chartreusis]|uniref:phosphotransferase family protein n=1 Tax=Streptomyces chartreusis TaxID=1969 RepID=UPI0036441C37